MAPAIVALVLYSLLPVVRNTAVGLAGVDGAVIEAARGMGLTSRQIFRQVELPLALPVLLAGLRIVTDLAAPADSRMMTVPGQSGNPLSPHYADLLMRWRQFDWLVPGRAAATATLVLEPAHD